MHWRRNRKPSRQEQYFIDMWQKIKVPKSHQSHADGKEITASSGSIGDAVMKALVITVPEVLKPQWLPSPMRAPMEKLDLETKSTRGQDTNWTLDFSDADTTEKSNKVTFEDYFRTVFPEYDKRKGAVSEYCVGDFFNITARQLPVKLVGKENIRKISSVRTDNGM